MTPPTPQMPTPVRDASRFLARLATLTPAEWGAVVAAATDDASVAAALAAAFRALALPGRREAYTVLIEWLDALATPLLAGAEPAGGSAHAARGLACAERAALALLVSDALDARSFARLYAPFAVVVPLPALRGGGGAATRV